jgi:hypothetical protein
LLSPFLFIKNKFLPLFLPNKEKILTPIRILVKQD